MGSAEPIDFLRGVLEPINFLDGRSKNCYTLGYFKVANEFAAKNDKRKANFSNKKCV